MNFLSIRPRFHSSLTSLSVHPPACSRRLLSHSLPLPMRLQSKAPRSVPLAPKWVPLSRAEPPVRPSRHAPHRRRVHGLRPVSRRGQGLSEGTECWAEGRQDRRGYTGSPNFRGDPGIALCPAPQQALQWQPALSLSPSDLGESQARRRSPLRSPM